MPSFLLSNCRMIGTKKILVTGAAGFIGFHLVKRLAESGGFNIIGLDSINSYYDVNLKYGRLAELGIDNAGSMDMSGNDAKVLTFNQSSKYANFSFIKADISDYDTLARIFEECNFDIVCNLAAQAGVRYSFENPFSYIKSNVNGFMNILELSRIHNISHVVYASSSSVYGNNEKIPFDESDRTDNPQSIYAASKKANELMAHVYSSQMGMATTGLRFFTVYGPWGRPDMAPFLFMKSVLEGKKIRIFNHGNLSRDFSYIDDIVEGIAKVVESNPSGGDCKIYNIGNSSPVKLMDFVRTIEEVAGKEAIKEFTDMQQGDVYITYANTASIEKDFGFKPCTPLKYGIEEFYKWYTEFYSFSRDRSNG